MTVEVGHNRRFGRENCEYNFEKGGKFSYLEVTISNTNEEEAKIEEKIVRGNRCLLSLSNRYTGCA